MPRANEIKKGMVLNYNGKLLLVKDIDIQSPTARGAATTLAEIGIRLR